MAAVRRATYASSMGKKPARSPHLFRVFKSTDRQSLIVRYPYQDDSDLEYGYAEAAKRLAASFQGQPIDDTILLPFMYLWRHAVELSLKQQIKLAARLRRANGEEDESLDPEKLRGWLNRTHSMRELATSLAAHFAELDLPKMPQETNRTLSWFIDADPNGQTFRYAGGLPDTQDFIDFPALNKCLEDTYNMVSAGIDVLWAYSEAQEDFLAERREFEAEMRADFEAEMRAEYGSEFGGYADY
ncbi:hypothetical protein ACFFGR_02710 [Arthrobacter liuii]|uniref:Uncharacterized protein n=1 Tax=Arthrobacter liuii TaxID=1476996 RepID=A0ABQ2ANJ7_9MICC|nr:hypothetical protein [Arthrobacter liuii]GGH94650.1 hypothetical protein GCM10007170_18340 [Arthrobacter liuii]